MNRPSTESGASVLRDECKLSLLSLGPNLALVGDAGVDTLEDDEDEDEEADADVNLELLAAATAAAAAAAAAVGERSLAWTPTFLPP